MAKKVLTRTAVAGVSSEDRRVTEMRELSAISAAPTLTSDGTLLNRNEFIHLLFQLNATDSTTTYYVQLWWYSPVSTLWHKGETLAVNGNDLHTIECQGLSRLYLQLDSIVLGSSESSNSNISAWISLVVPVA